MSKRRMDMRNHTVTVNNHHHHHKHDGLKGDTWGDELVRDGIITTQRPTNIILPSGPPLQHNRDTVLALEMHKYSIDNDTQA